MFIWKEEVATRGIWPVVVEKAGQRTVGVQHLHLMGASLCLTIAEDAEQMEVRGGNLCRGVKTHFRENGRQRGTTDVAQKIKLTAIKVRGLSIVRVKVWAAKCCLWLWCGHRLGIMCSEFIDIRCIEENWQQDRLSSAILGQHASSLTTRDAWGVTG